MRSQGTSGNIVNELWAGQPTNLIPGMGRDFFLATIMSRPSQPPVTWVRGALSTGVKWLGHE